MASEPIAVPDRAAQPGTARHGPRVGAARLFSGPVRTPDRLAAWSGLAVRTKPVVHPWQGRTQVSKRMGREVFFKVILRGACGF